MPIKNALNPVSKKAIKAFQKASPQIIQNTVGASLKRKNEVQQHGDNAELLLTNGLTFTTQMLESAMAMGEIPLLEDELQWAKDRLPHDGVEMEHVLVRLKIYREEVKELLEEKYAQEIIPYIDWMIRRQEELI